MRTPTDYWTDRSAILTACDEAPEALLLVVVLVLVLGYLGFSITSTRTTTSTSLALDYQTR